MNVNTNSRTPIKVKNGSYKDHSGVIVDPSPAKKSWVKLDGKDKHVCLFKNQLEETITVASDASKGTNENENPTAPKRIAATPHRPTSILRASSRDNVGRSPVVDMTKGVSFNYPSDAPQPERKTPKPVIRRHSVGSGHNSQSQGRRRSLNSSAGRRRNISRRHSSFEFRTSSRTRLSPRSRTTMVAIGGTSIVPYETTLDTTSSSWIKLQSITAMPQYEDKSFEELRLEDYNHGTFGGSATSTFAHDNQTYNKHGRNVSDKWEIDPQNWRRLRRQKGSDETVFNGELYEFKARNV